ncbi:MAG: hypothetical protein LBT14_08475 [Treponema sp.]|nr:hypothetical protein [Treponema sp.]
MGAEKIFVVGAGTMGSGISQTALQGGYQVYRYDTVAGAPEQAISGIESRLARSAEKGKISLDEKNSMMNRIEAAHLQAAADCSIVIEAVFENYEVKSALFKQIASFLGKKNGKGFYCYDENGKNIGVNPIFKGTGA